MVGGFFWTSKTWRFRRAGDSHTAASLMSVSGLAVDLGRALHSPGTVTQIQCQSLVASICLPCQTLKAFHILTVTLYLYHIFNLTVTRAKKLAWDSFKNLYFVPQIQQPIVSGLIANCYSTKQENWLSTCYEWKKIQQYLAKEILKCIVAVRCI